MSEILTFSADELTPSRAAVLENQGIPVGKAVSAEVVRLCDAAFGLLLEFAEPTGVLHEISRPEFETVYRGEGRNEAHTPVGDIFDKADVLALYAVTLGQRISQEITDYFASSEFALGAMLDAAASAAADQLSQVAERRFADRLAADGRATQETGILGYSPGYCGWHISGQRQLFDFLHPEQIGISLTDTYLMQPLKSVSGVLIAGPKRIHDLQTSYPCCTQCLPRTCRERIRGWLLR